MNVSSHKIYRLASATGLGVAIAMLAIPAAFAGGRSTVSVDNQALDPAIVAAIAAHQRTSPPSDLRSPDTIVGRPDKGWYEALKARSDALDRRYGRGAYAQTVSGHDTPAWRQALDARSDALDRRYGLGKYARTPGSNAPDWRTALTARSDALDRQYRLGKYGK